MMHYDNCLYHFRLDIVFFFGLLDNFLGFRFILETPTHRLQHINRPVNKIRVTVYSFM